MSPLTMTFAPPYVFDVRDYGAEGDGVTDDSAALQAALDAGGLIRASPGTYICAGLVMSQDQTHLIGSGIGTTVLKLKSGSTSSLLSGPSGVMRYFCSIRDLRIDGNKAGCPSGGHAIWMRNAHTWALSDLHIDVAADSGIKVEGVFGAALNNTMTRLRVENSKNQCVFISTNAPNNHVTNCVLGGCDNFHALELANDENTVTGCHVHGPCDVGIQVGGSNNTIMGGYVESANNDGIYLAGDGNRVKGTIVFNNGFTVTSRAGVAVAGDYNDVDVRSFDRRGTKKQAYGVRVITGASGTILRGHLRDAENLTAGILDGGTATLQSGVITA